MLAQFTGSETFYQHALTTAVNTEGAKYVAEAAGAYWLLDSIALNQAYNKKVKAEEFQVWKLAVHEEGATLTCDDGNGNVVLTEQIEYTDFPAEGVTLWFQNNTILLPSEY